jgi:flagellar protein FliO/FliZ
MDQFALLLRVVLALTVVLGLMWAMSRMLRGRGVGTGVQLEVVARTPLGKRASVAVLRVADTRGMIVGVTDHQVSLLGEMELPAPASTTSEVRETITLPTSPARSTGGDSVSAATAVELPVNRTPLDSKLGGSILAPSTWKQAAATLREKTVRQ